jgi:hypothetical protein
MDATSNEYVLADIATGGYVQRVRSRCDLETGIAQLNNWECRPSTGQDTAQVGDFTPSTVAVLYGAR